MIRTRKLPGAASNKWRQEFFEKRHQSMSLPGRYTSKYGNFLCKYDGKDLSVTCIDGSVTIFHDFNSFKKRKKVFEKTLPANQKIDSHFATISF